MNVRVKICGITRVEDAARGDRLGADMIGLNFYPPSPRSLSIERALEIRAAAGDAQLVGRLRQCRRANISPNGWARCGLDMLQFHGDEDEEALAGWPVQVIRALRLQAANRHARASRHRRPTTAARHLSSGTIRRTGTIAFARRLRMASI